MLVLLIQSLRWQRSSLVKTGLNCLELTNGRFNVSMSLINVRMPARCTGLSYWDVVNLPGGCWVAVQNTSLVGLLLKMLLLEWVNLLLLL